MESVSCGNGRPLGRDCFSNTSNRKFSVHCEIVAKVPKRSAVIQGAGKNCWQQTSSEIINQKGEVMSEITLTAGIRTNLVSLQRTNDLLSITQSRLATGKRVNSAIDNPNSFFKASNLNDRASKLDARLDAMGQAVSAVKAADLAITSMKAITSQMKAVAEDVKGETDGAARGNLGDQFNVLLKQVNTLAKDALYAGTNFLQGSSVTETTTAKGNQTLTVQFNEKLDESTLTLQGFSVGNNAAEPTALSISGSELGLSNVTVQGHVGGTTGTGSSTAVDFAGADYQTSMNAVIGNIENFEIQLESASKGLANNLAIITTRQDFTQKQVNILQEGADKLVLADLNEEGANLLALNTSQQLGVSSLSLASQANQAVLRLVG
jgi:flagellin